VGDTSACDGCLPMGALAADEGGPDAAAGEDGSGAGLSLKHTPLVELRPELPEALKGASEISPELPAELMLSQSGGDHESSELADTSESPCAADAAVCLEPEPAPEPEVLHVAEVVDSQEPTRPPYHLNSAAGYEDAMSMETRCRPFDAVAASSERPCDTQARPSEKCDSDASSDPSFTESALQFQAPGAENAAAEKEPAMGQECKAEDLVAPEVSAIALMCGEDEQPWPATPTSTPSQSPRSHGYLYLPTDATSECIYQAPGEAYSSLAPAPPPRAAPGERRGAGAGEEVAAAGAGPGEEGPRSERPPRAPRVGVDGREAYPHVAAGFFGEHFAHRLRWAHAVNSKRRLRSSLGTSANFLEADVSKGPLVVWETPQAALAAPEGREGAGVAQPAAAAATRSPKGGGRRLRSQLATEQVTVRTSLGDPVIMAHYPTELSSDLSLEAFISGVLQHNEKVDTQLAIIEVDEKEAATTGRRRLSQRRAVYSVSSDVLGDEAARFERDLDGELDERAASSGGAIASCVGSRRDHPLRHKCHLTKKGVKLDFKQIDCVAPTVAYLRDTDAAAKLGGHLWLNADVLAGPGALLHPFDAKEFVKICAEGLPEAVLSLSWGSSWISTTRLYTDEMIRGMVELCMTPMVSLPHPPGIHADVYFTPAAICRHITFAIAAEYALSSAAGLHMLLENVPNSSLTIFSGSGSFGITPGHVKELITTYGTSRVFLDLKLSKAWRTCGVGRNYCSLQ